MMKKEINIFIQENFFYICNKRDSVVIENLLTYSNIGFRHWIQLMISTHRPVHKAYTYVYSIKHISNLYYIIILYVYI